MMGYSIPSRAPISSLQSAIRISFSPGAAAHAMPRRNIAASPGACRTRHAAPQYRRARHGASFAPKNTFTIKLFYYITIRPGMQARFFP
jgi:hypothetical protein